MVDGVIFSKGRTKGDGVFQLWLVDTKDFNLFFANGDVLCGASVLFCVVCAAFCW